MTTRKVTGLALLIAVGTAAGILVIPVPLVQSVLRPACTNVLFAVWFGRGRQSPPLLWSYETCWGQERCLPFPAGWPELLTGLAYRILAVNMAAAGEISYRNTGALLAFPLARYILGHEVMALAYIVPFALSSTAGACAAFVVLRIFSAAAKLSQQKKNKEL